MILVFDTETTGLPDFRAPSDAPHQPHLVQFAASLHEADGTDRGLISVMVRPDGWQIPPEVVAVHGISDAVAQHGIPEKVVALLFESLVSSADTVVAHNDGFDWRVMRIALLRAGADRKRCEELEGRPRQCTMRMADGIMQLPPTERMMAAGFRKSKPPNLTECMSHFFGETHDKAHDALADVRACARVYFHLLKSEPA